MADVQGVNLSSSLSTNNVSTLSNGTDQGRKIYVFTPAGSSTKLTLLILMVTVGTIGFVGSILILCFLNAKKKTASFLKSLSFEKNFNVYINSLAISDVLCNLISLPSVCIQFYFDVFQDVWGCRIARYLQILFPSVTMNNLLVISIEKYFSTRKVPRPFRHYTVKKLVLFAWLAAVVHVLFPASTFNGIRYDLNETHYTMICKYDKHYLPFRIIFLSYILFQYIIPSFFIIATSVCLIITVLTTTRRTMNVLQDNAIKAMLRAAKRRATIIIVAIMFAFVIPYITYFGQVFFNMATKRDIDFQTDYIIRYGSAVLAYSNSAINVIIYFVQMKDFRAFVKTKFISMFRAENPNSVALDNSQIEME